MRSELLRFHIPFDTPATINGIKLCDGVSLEDSARQQHEKKTKEKYRVASCGYRVSLEKRQSSMNTDPEHQQQQQRIATNSLCKNRKTKFSTNGKSNRCLTEIGWGCFASWSSKQQQQLRETRTTAPFNPSTLSLDHHSPSSSMQTTLERQQPATSAPQTRHNNNNKKQQNTLKGDTSSIRPAFH